MSTNDTLRGLLLECRGIVANEVAKWDRMAALLPVNSKVESDLLNRIDAALAEPVSGGVSDERAAFEAEYLALFNKQRPWGIAELTELKRIPGSKGERYAEAAIHHCWEGWQARAALNGGAVAGQSPAAILAAKGVSSQSLGAEFASALADNLQDLLITDDKPLESERGGE